MMLFLARTLSGFGSFSLGWSWSDHQISSMRKQGNLIPLKKKKKLWITRVNWSLLKFLRIHPNTWRRPLSSVLQLIDVQTQPAGCMSKFPKLLEMSRFVFKEKISEEWRHRVWIWTNQQFKKLPHSNSIQMVYESWLLDVLAESNKFTVKELKSPYLYKYKNSPWPAFFGHFGRFPLLNHILYMRSTEVAIVLPTNFST